MDSWNVYSQNPSGTPGTAWLCPQNNTQGSDWLHPQNNSTERERNENTALATPTRFIMELNDLNQNPSSNSYFDRLFEHNFLKLGNQEDLLNNGVNGVYSNEDFSSFLNSNLPATSAPNISVSIPTTTSNVPNDINSPTPSLVTDDGKDQLYNLQDDRMAQYPIATSASFLPTSIPAYFAGNNNQQRQSPTTKSVDENQNISRKMTTSSSNLKNLSPTMVNKSHQREHHQTNYPMTSSSSFYQSTPVSTLVADNKDLYVQDAQQRMFSSTFDNRDQYLQSKKHDPKQLLLPLTVSKTSMDDTMTVAITSPSSSLDTDDDMDQCDQVQQRKVKTHRQSVYQDFPLSITTNDLPIQQPSPSSSEYFSSGTKSPPSSHETTPKEKKRRALQKKSNSKRSAKFHEKALITPVDESFTDIQEKTTSSTESGESSSITVSNVASTSTISNSDASTSSMSSPSDDHVTCVGIKRNHLDDGHDETPEEKRSRLLERNRIAAAKCRQKKKQAQETLQQQASDLSQKNTGLSSIVNDLREEALRLKNQLLAHSTCNCNVIQEYVRTSGQFAFARPPYTK